MKKIVIIIFIIISNIAFAQNLQEMELPELDSVKYGRTAIDMEKIPSNFSVDQFKIEPLKLQSFDFNRMLNSKWNYEYVNLNNNFFDPNYLSLGIMRNSPVLQGNYQINDNISFKTSTFDVNSIYGLPLMGNTLNSNYEVKSIQLDYKVSKNVTISVGGNTVIKKNKFP